MLMREVMQVTRTPAMPTWLRMTRLLWMILLGGQRRSSRSSSKWSRLFQHSYWSELCKAEFSEPTLPRASYRWRQGTWSAPWSGTRWPTTGRSPRSPGHPSSLTWCSRWAGTCLLSGVRLSWPSHSLWRVVARQVWLVAAGHSLEPPLSSPPARTGPSSAGTSWRGATPPYRSRTPPGTPSPASPGTTLTRRGIWTGT